MLWHFTYKILQENSIFLTHSLYGVQLKLFRSHNAKHQHPRAPSIGLLGAEKSKSKERKNRDIKLLFSSMLPKSNQNCYNLQLSAIRTLIVLSSAYNC